MKTSMNSSSDLQTARVTTIINPSFQLYSKHSTPTWIYALKPAATLLRYQLFLHHISRSRNYTEKQFGKFSSRQLSSQYIYTWENFNRSHKATCKTKHDLSCAPILDNLIKARNNFKRNRRKHTKPKINIKDKISNLR